MELTLISGTAHPELAQAVAARIGRRLGEVAVKRFADGEIDVQILENVRRHHVAIIQPTPPPAENWVELFLLLDAARRASAAEVTVVMPYIGYSRQDRKDQPRKPISSARMLRLTMGSGADRILTIELHAGQTQATIDEPFDNLFFTPLLLKTLGPRDWRRKTVLVSPDAGGMERCRAIAKRLGCPVAMIDKRRPRANESEVMHVVGDVRDREAILLDDIVDTAGSLVLAAAALRDNGARRVAACCTHPVLSPKSLKRLARSPLSDLVVADTLPIPASKRGAIGRKLRVVSCAGMLAAAIRRIHSEDSLSVIFEETIDELVQTAH